MEIQTHFFKHLNQIFPLDTKSVLVAVSSGIDSMALLDLLQNTSFSLNVAHVNFQLRGAQSDADEKFVENFCKDREIPFHVRRFDTLDYLKTNKKSIQVVARDLRYKWFSYLLRELKLSYIAIAHHLDDALETFFINLMRGTGLKGLLGIPNSKNCILRPLLPFTRKQIFQYAKIRNLQWREDLSNQEYKYLRNSVRHRLVPLLTDLSPDLYKKFSTTLLNLNQDYILSERTIQSALKEVTLSKKETPFQWEIDIPRLKKYYPLRAYLFRLFSPYGFKNTTDLEHLLCAQSGKQLFSPFYRIVNDRNRWLLVEKKNAEKKTHPIHTPDVINEPLSLSFTINDHIIKRALVSIDFGKILNPLLLRNWCPGDYFYPFGMCQRKKISKFFKDEKFNLLQKEATWILVNADGVIIWIVGYRLDDRFKVSSKTQSILNIIQL